MDRATALAVVTVAKLLEDARGRGLEVGEDAALVLGTSTGSVQSIMNFTRDSLVRSRPYLVNPAEFPNTVMNCAAGQCAIWHRLRGPNATIAGGRASGLVALNYALRLQRSGHATTVLCGAVEEFSVVRAWLEHHTRRDSESESTLGEGCALLLLQGHSPEGEQNPATEVLALEFGLACGEEEIESVLATCLRRALERGGVVAAEVAVVAPSREECRLAQAESRAVDRVLGSGERTVLHTLHALGEEQAASATFQILSCLEASGVGGSVALVTSTDHDGFVGCALLRLG
jgi:3-oxoacyl-[acyl-carrier-protein] synthase II